MRSFRENDYCSYKFQDGILYITYHDNVTINFTAAVQIVEDRLILQEGQAYPILCDIRGIKEINKSARTYFAMEGSLFITAVAVIVEPPVTEMLSEFYIRTSNPPIPMKSFSSVPLALVFLEGFMP